MGFFLKLLSFVYAKYSRMKAFHREFAIIELFILKLDFIN